MSLFLEIVLFSLINFFSVLRTDSSGHVKMTVNLVTQGFDDLGYDIN